MSDASYLKQKSAKDWKKSDHHGAREWIAERLTSIILVPLTVWALWSAISISGGGYPAAIAFVRTPLHSGLIGVLAAISVWHMYMGLKAIIDDYFAGAMRGFLTFLSFALSAGIFIATAVALYLVNQGA
jgi:succinate dehydrogenase / fumarate reductase, membrane anchor subunit